VRPTKRRRRLDSGSVTEISTWVRDRENLREISRCAHLEGEQVTYVRSAPTRTPADHPWLSQGSSQAERLGDWALVREKVAVRPPPPLRTRAGEATQRGLFVAGRREAPHTASTGGAQAGHPIAGLDGETMNWSRMTSSEWDKEVVEISARDHEVPGPTHIHLPSGVGPPSHGGGHSGRRPSGSGRGGLTDSRAGPGTMADLCER